MKRRPRKSHLFVVLGLACAFALGAVLPGAFAGEKQKEPEVIRDSLAQTDRVQGAPGRALAVTRITVDPGAKLPLHHHLGTQVSHIMKGTLTYTVRRGAAAVVRTGQSDANPRLVRRIKPGQTGRIRSGQWVVEQPSSIHEAANRGSVPVEIILATLLKRGAPPATPVAEN